MEERLQGPAGWAVQQDIPKFPDESAWSATLASWFCCLPGQSVAWDKYAMAAIHLRDIPGVRPAVRRFPDAEYELIVAALDPEKNPRPNGFENQLALRPINYVRQISAPTDDDVRRLLRALAEQVVAGGLPAEPMLTGGPGTEHDRLWDEAVDRLLGRVQ